VLERQAARFLSEDLEPYFDDLGDAAERIWDQLENFKEVVEGLESTNESFLVHRQNYRIQLLTVVSVVLLPLTLLASIFGMNVEFPGEGTHEAFWVILGVMSGLGAALVGVFFWRRWL
jgi:magnesium transporter